MSHHRHRRRRHGFFHAQAPAQNQAGQDTSNQDQSSQSQQSQNDDKGGCDH
ncbi:MAG TPA: hypothetical protein VGI67_15340 [Thermoleophilaceae bacterium]|jgi:hypothetical protein